MFRRTTMERSMLNLFIQIIYTEFGESTMCLILILHQTPARFLDSVYMVITKIMTDCCVSCCAESTRRHSRMIECMRTQSANCNEMHKVLNCEREYERRTHFITSSECKANTISRRRRLLIGKI